MTINLYVNNGYKQYMDQLKVISEAAEKIDGNTSKFNFIVKQVSENFPQLAKKTVMSLKLIILKKLFQKK